MSTNTESTTDMRHSLNDAILMPWGHGHEIVRVCAITNDGCAVASLYGTIKYEPYPGAWKSVGYFLPKTLTLWQSMFGCGGEREWMFFPNG